ncbi:uncharacterized protein LOC123295096 isoform X2 [Chrysoperla carnea]|uniref:uncharacterized protein LOC123295096 isoform X1 n=1 Tax=Chrysoperla carnea TaxID=189513 RepID=UPI001D06985A|nr:uncharacterized protein LOC123295096 isoform X1 [Chrysoperla carnea]XP_044732248.1 uncharacterized protein LOC123295096 isoform X2 [Chrysoperla carnea]
MEMIREWVNHTEPNLGYKEGFVDDADEDKDKDNSQNRNEIEEEKNDRMKDLDTRQTKSKSYTMWEQREILKYIFINKYENQVMGNKIWQRMELEQIVKERTWQSLRNHFRRTILTEPTFSLLVKEKGKELLTLYHS